MERDKEVRRLVSVAHRIARAAHYAAWTRSSPDGARFCAQQYNRVLARLRELEPGVAPLFVELAEDAPPEVIRMAAQELAAYFEDEAKPAGRRGEHARSCGARVWVGAIRSPRNCW